MKILNISIYLLFIVLFWSCNRNSDKESFEILEHTGIEKDLFIGRGGYMAYVENNHQVIGIDDLGQTCFYSLNTDSAHYDLCHFGDKGQGPDEFITPFSIQYIADNTVGCWDLHLKSFHEFSISLNCSEFKKLKVIPFYDFNFSVIKTAYNQYIGIGAYENEMFTLFDANGKKINAFFEYPYKDHNERQIKNRLRSMAYQGQITSNTAKTKFVYSSSFADIIHFYEIKENEITTIKKIENSYPEYITEEKNGGISAPIKSTNKHGYICAYATDNYIYLLYSGKSYSEYKEKTAEADFLKIYDWKGDLQKNIQLDIPCRFLCVSNDDTKMWAITYNPDPAIISFDFKKKSHISIERTKLRNIR